MSKISGKQFSEPFHLHVVSGMVVDGSLYVSWATGDHATSQIDWGFDSSVPHQTPVRLLGPGDRGYHPDNEIPMFARYHRIAFPQTYVDTEHFFRAVSVNRSGEKKVSRVYSVYVTDRVVLESELRFVSVDIHPIEVSTLNAATLSFIETNPTKGTAIEVDHDIQLTPLQEEIGLSSQQTEPQKTTLQTSITFTLD